jgi:hypothetical protein
LIKCFSLLSGLKIRYERSFYHLPESLELFKTYFITYKPQEYFFEGQYGWYYSSRTAQQLFKNRLVKALIYKSLGIHNLQNKNATISRLKQVGIMWNLRL